MLGLSNVVIPFVACGDLNGFDADKSYPLQLTSVPDDAAGGLTKGGEEGEEDYVYSYRKPVQPPIRPNYHTYQQTAQQGGGGTGKVTLDI
jgi:tRNA (cytidine32/guanosine34-2'-O)-methyltransferase